MRGFSWIFVCLLSFIFGTACVGRINAPTPILPTLTPASTLNTGPIILFAVDDDLWQTTLYGNQVDRITDGRILNWGMGQGDDWLLAAKWRPPQASPDGRWITVSPTGRDIILVDVATGVQQQVSLPGAPVATWSPDSRYFAYSPDSSVSSSSDDLYLYDIQTQQSRHLLQLDKDDGVGIVSIVWSPDGRFIAFGCCFNADTNNGAFTGKVQQIEVATGNIETVREMWSSIGGGYPELCWTVDGPMILESIKEEVDGSFPCSYRQRVNTKSPDGDLMVSLSPASLDDAFWTGPSLLTIKMSLTDSVLWQYEIEENVKRIAWSPDSQYLFLDNDQNSSPIWRVKADGLSELEIVVDDGYLLDVIAQSLFEKQSLSYSKFYRLMFPAHPPISK